LQPETVSGNVLDVETLSVLPAEVAARQVPRKNRGFPDTTSLYRLALEKGSGGVRYHAVAEEGVPARAIAETIGRGLNLAVVSMTPEQAAGHFGWLAHFVEWDLPASSAWTRAELKWNPTGPGLISDLENMRYQDE
jgi:hypothetical protein